MSKEIPAQADVRIVGGKTSVRLRAYAEATLNRFNALLLELNTNAATHAEIAKAVKTNRDALVQLNLALGFSGLPTSPPDAPSGNTTVSNALKAQEAARKDPPRINRLD
jgi:hypothetical protein